MPHAALSSRPAMDVRGDDRSETRACRVERPERNTEVVSGLGLEYVQRGMTDALPRHAGESFKSATICARAFLANGAEQKWRTVAGALRQRRHNMSLPTLGRGDRQHEEIGNTQMRSVPAGSKQVFIDRKLGEKGRLTNPCSDDGHRSAVDFESEKPIIRRCANQILQPENCVRNDLTSTGDSGIALRQGWTGNGQAKRKNRAPGLFRCLGENFRPRNETHVRTADRLQLDRGESLTDHQRMHELPPCAARPVWHMRTGFGWLPMRSQHLPGSIAVLIGGRQVAGMRRLPLLLGPVQIAAFMVEIAEPFLETRFRCSTNERVYERRAQIAITLQ